MVPLKPNELSRPEQDHWTPSRPLGHIISAGILNYEDGIDDKCAFTLCFCSVLGAARRPDQPAQTCISYDYETPERSEY